MASYLGTRRRHVDFLTVTSSGCRTRWPAGRPHPGTGTVPGCARSIFCSMSLDAGLRGLLLLADPSRRRW